MPRLVCLDTQILIWGVQEVAKDGQEDMIDRASYLLKQLHKEKAQIIIPSIVLGEFLVKFEDEQEALRRFEKRGFQIAPYDPPASVQFARIWRKNVSLQVKKEISEDTRITRQELKADICILATAVTRRAECIYSADRKHMSRFAQGFIEVHDLRIMSLLGPLFDSPSAADT